MSNKKLKKPINQRGHWIPFKSEALDLLACEAMVMEFVQQGSSLGEDVKPITDISLYEFWQYIQHKKDKLEEEREQ
jgi:hypothetical protein